MKHKVLYVEDEPFLGKIVKEALESQGFEILLVSDGAKVLNTFKDFEPGICILDIMLPNIDGLTLGKQIRELYPALPIIFLTAKTGTDDLVKGFESGGTDYIKKPFSIKELIVRINNQLKLNHVTNGQSKNPEFSEYTFGNFRFFPAQYKLVYGNKKITLSAREAQVLKILAANQNQTVDRKILLFSVWGDDSYFNSRNLDVYIRKLRAYLADDPRIEILTLKGVGYQFIVSPN